MNTDKQAEEIERLRGELAIRDELLGMVRWAFIGSGQYQCAFCEMAKGLDRHWWFCKYAKAIEPDKPRSEPK